MTPWRFEGLTWHLESVLSQLKNPSVRTAGHLCFEGLTFQGVLSEPIFHTVGRLCWLWTRGRAAWVISYKPFLCPGELNTTHKYKYKQRHLQAWRNTNTNSAWISCANHFIFFPSILVSYSTEVLWVINCVKKKKKLNNILQGLGWWKPPLQTDG